MISPDYIIKVLKSDFSERVGEEATLSQEHLSLTKLKDRIKHKQDGHYEMPLPFKRDTPNLPNNMVCALQHLMCLGWRFNSPHRISIFEIDAAWNASFWVSFSEKNCVASCCVFQEFLVMKLLEKVKIAINNCNFAFL